MVRRWSCGGRRYYVVLSRRSQERALRLAASRLCRWPGPAAWKVSQIAQPGEVEKRAGCYTQARLVDCHELAYEQRLERAVAARAPDAFDAGRARWAACRQ
jgi:hypothetical protein